MAMTPTFSEMLKNYTLFGIPFTITSWYAGLLTGTTGTPIEANEISGTGYARQPIQWGADWKNLNEISWFATDVWGTATQLMLCSGASGQNGLLYQAMTSTNFQPDVGIVIPVGSLTLNIL